MNINFLKSTLKGTVAGVAIIAAVSLIVSLALTLTDDPLPLITACGIAADFAGGLGAAVVAVALNRAKPLATALTAGGCVSALLAIMSAIFGGDGLPFAIGAVMLGSLIASLVPAFSIKRNTGIKRLKAHPGQLKRSFH